jgi:hypothetical protein
LALAAKVRRLTEVACSKALERFLALMGRHLARASEANAALGPRAENAANFFRSSARAAILLFEQGAVGDLR